MGSAINDKTLKFFDRLLDRSTFRKLSICKNPQLKYLQHNLNDFRVVEHFQNFIPYKKENSNNIKIKNVVTFYEIICMRWRETHIGDILYMVYLI